MVCTLVALSATLFQCKKKIDDIAPEVLHPTPSAPTIVMGRDTSNGVVYTTLLIGSQKWMAEDLRVTTFNDGTPIPLVTADSVWNTLATPGMCWSNNSAVMTAGKYGALYNWHVVNTGKLCPKTWHVPTDAEWSSITNYLGTESVAGGKMKEEGAAHWKSPNTGGTNETNFGALPSGMRYPKGAFGGFSTNAYWWSATALKTDTSWARGASYDFGYGYKFYSPMKDGFCVRCIKD